MCGTYDRREVPGPPGMLTQGRQTPKRRKEVKPRMSSGVPQLYTHTPFKIIFKARNFTEENILKRTESRIIQLLFYFLFYSRK